MLFVAVRFIIAKSLSDGDQVVWTPLLLVAESLPRRHLPWLAAISDFQ
jgi:hypothetical protein